MSDNAILANSIWPNGIKVDADGHAVFYPLGTNKIEVPSEDKWPKGDTLVSPFVYEDGLLVGFVDTKAMTVSGNTSITLPYEHIEADFSSILQGDLTVNAPNAEYKNFIWAVVAGEGGVVEINFKYKGCKTVSEVKAVDANYLTTDIVDGAWTESLADLEDGSDMFSWMGDYCQVNPHVATFTSFNADLSSLTKGERMFNGCTNLANFTSDLSSLENGYMMFNGCDNLTTFNSDLSSLTSGENMFNGCNKLTTFTSDLSSLTCGHQMFYGCKLDTASVQNIAETISIYDANTGGSFGSKLTIGIGNTQPSDEEIEAFDTMATKGWTVYVNGSKYTPSSTCCASLTTLDENGEETVTPIPFYAKPIPSDEEHATYIDENGNFFNILGAQFIYGDDLSTYGMFINEEDAAANMRLTKIGAEEIETA